MKRKNKIALLILLLGSTGFLLESCSKAFDNAPSYPGSRISGTFLYKSQPVGLLGSSNDINSTNNSQNPLVIEQIGPGTYSSANIKVFARNDGTYTILTFDGDYIVRPVPGKNPFVLPESKTISLKGEATVDFNVTPYFWVSNYQTTFVDSVFTATFQLDKLVNSVGTQAVNLEKVVVYFNTTSLVDNSAKAFERSFTTVAQGVNINGNCTIKVDLKAMSAIEKQTIMATTGVIYANVAVKTATLAADALYQKPVLLK